MDDDPRNFRKQPQNEFNETCWISDYMIVVDHILSSIKMKMRSIVYLFCFSALPLGRGDRDRFNYRSTVSNDYGPEDWSKVTCDVVGNCPGWPDGWKLGVGWHLENNLCQSCPESGNTCGLHSQSPINLLRSDATTGHNTEWYDIGASKENLYEFDVGSGITNDWLTKLLLWLVVFSTQLWLPPHGLRRPFLSLARYRW